MSVFYEIRIKFGICSYCWFISELNISWVSSIRIYVIVLIYFKYKSLNFYVSRELYFFIFKIMLNKELSNF